MAKISEQTLFATPKDWTSVEKWIEAHPAHERPALYTAAIMTWNLAAKLTNNEGE